MPGSYTPLSEYILKMALSTFPKFDAAWRHAAAEVDHLTRELGNPGRSWVSRESLRKRLSAAQSELDGLSSMTEEEYQKKIGRVIEAGEERGTWRSAFEELQGLYRHDRSPLQNLWCFAAYGLRPGRAFLHPVEAELNRREHDEEQAHETAIQEKYRGAVAQWNELEARAKAHGIRFSSTAQAHHRAAILDYLDHPEAPTHVTHCMTTWLSVYDLHGRQVHDGEIDRHPTLRAIYALRSKHHPGLYPPKRLQWTDHQHRQYREHERQFRDLVSRLYGSGELQGAWRTDSISRDRFTRPTVTYHHAALSAFAAKHNLD